MDDFWDVAESLNESAVVSMCNAQQCYYFRVRPRQSEQHLGATARDSTATARYAIASMQKDDDEEYVLDYEWEYPSNAYIVINRLFKEGYQLGRE